MTCLHWHSIHWFRWVYLYTNGVYFQTTEEIPGGDITSSVISNYQRKTSHSARSIYWTKVNSTKRPLVISSGAYNLKANLYFEEDTAAMLDSLLELFQENGDKVTATLNAERMGSKLHRHTPSSSCRYFITGCSGFIPFRGKEHDDRSKYYVVPDYDLLARCRVHIVIVLKNIKDK